MLVSTVLVHNSNAHQSLPHVTLIIPVEQTPRMRAPPTNHPICFCVRCVRCVLYVVWGGIAIVKDFTHTPGNIQSSAQSFIPLLESAPWSRLR